MKRLWPLLLVLFVSLFSIVIWLALKGPSDTEVAGRDKIKVQLQWFPSAQFIGFYVAQDKNFYAEEGLSIEFLHGGPDVNPIKNVAQGQAEIGLSTGDQVLVWADKNVDPNNEIKAFGTVFNESIACFMSRSSDKISEPSDLIGKSVGVFPSYDTEHLLLCMLHRKNIPVSQVKVVNFPTLVSFQEGSVQVLGAYSINEPIWAKQQNMQVQLLKPSEFGVRFYSDTLITKVSYYKTNREKLKRFVRASSRGWSFAEQNPEEAVKSMYRVVRGQVGEGTPRERQEAMVREIIKGKYLRAGPDKFNFFMEKSRWDDMEQDLVDIGRLSKTGRIDNICDFTLVNEAMK